MEEDATQGADTEADPLPVEDALGQVLRRLFGRLPGPKLREIWEGKLKAGVSSAEFVRQAAGTKLFQSYAHIRMQNPPGHFFSPVVDPEQVRAHVARARLQGPEDIQGIVLDTGAMAAFWTAHQDFIAATPFSDKPDGVNRYSYLAGPYRDGDAVVLRAMIGAYRPARIVEMGSGYSSACMLDSAGHAGLAGFHLTCIEPYPERLRSVLRPGDSDHIEIIERPAQDVPLDVFRTLQKNDILFIDSTHVLKTGSDVHYAFFEILPLLRPGVLIHFHDCRFPFEYSDKQIFDKNYSWNEAYAVRALLMYSTRFKVVFWNSLFSIAHPELIEGVSAPFLRNPGSSIWLQAQDHAS